MWQGQQTPCWLISSYPWWHQKPLCPMPAQRSSFEAWHNHWLG
jgi:hypothetical protein